MRFILTLVLYAMLLVSAHSTSFAQEPQTDEPAPLEKPVTTVTPADVIDYSVMTNNAAALGELHQQRLVDLDTFLDMIKDEKTVLIDVRNAWEYQCAHVKGAVNMSLADITEESMKQIAPDKDSRIVIYCSDSLFFLPTRRIALTSMAFPVLYELGYGNVYELQYGYASGREELSRIPMVTEGDGPEDTPGRYQCRALRDSLGMDEPEEEPEEGMPLPPATETQE